MTVILHSHDVVKRFGDVVALMGVSLDVAAGERVALLGHNGAGKTTLLRAILGFLNMDSGQIKIDNSRPGSRHARQCVSYLPESVAFPKMLTGREIVTFYAKLKQVELSHISQVLERVDLAAAADRRCGTYSKGMRQRLGLAQALIGNPKLLLLDEPTSGLDPISRQKFYALIAEIAQNGTAVLQSSHGLGELEAKTDRVAILRNGRLIANAAFEELQRAANLPIRICLRTDIEHVENICKTFGGHRVNGTSVEFNCTQLDKMNHLNAISKLGAAVHDIEMSPPTLDEIYRHFSTSDTYKAEAP